MNKELYIIAGCNGAGKTTVSYTILPDILNCKEFVNADEIARGLSPFQPEKMAVEAGKIMLKRISELLDKGKSFAFETTLSGKSHRNTVCRAKDRGYTVSLLFFWLKTVDMAKQRVQMRVMRGGHDIADDVIERRYIRGIRYLFDIYMPIADIVMIFDNSDDKQELIAEKRKGTEILVIKDELKFNEIKNIMETQNEDVAKTAEIEEYEIFKKKILEGLELSFRRLLAEKKRNNEELVIMRGDEIVRVKPEELENIYQIN